MQSIVNNMQARLCTEANDNTQLLKDIEIIDKSNPAESNNDIRYGESDVRRLCRRFKLDELNAIQGMREQIET